MKFFANESFVVMLRNTPHNSLEAQQYAPRSKSLLEFLERYCRLVKLPLVSSHYAFLPLSSYFVAALISAFFCFLFLLFVLLFVLIFLTVAEAQPTPLQGMKSLNETVGDKDLGSLPAVSNCL